MKKTKLPTEADAKELISKLEALAKDPTIANDSEKMSGLQKLMDMANQQLILARSLKDGQEALGMVQGLIQYTLKTSEIEL